MGDRIAILQERSVIAQYDTPERILTDPSSAFVEDFIGSGASIKRLSLSHVRDIQTSDTPIAYMNDRPEDVRKHLEESGKDYVLLLDRERKPRRWVNSDDLSMNDVKLSEAGWPAVAIVEEKASLYDTLDTMITSYRGSAIVVNSNGSYRGVVDFETVLHAIESMRPPEERRSEADRDRVERSRAEG